MNPRLFAFGFLLLGGYSYSPQGRGPAE